MAAVGKKGDDVVKFKDKRLKKLARQGRRATRKGERAVRKAQDQAAGRGCAVVVIVAATAAAGLAGAILTVKGLA